MNILEALKSNHDNFKSKVDVPQTYTGILESEGYTFCTLCDLFKIERILESGTGEGRSTKIFSQYFDDVTIETIDRVDNLNIPNVIKHVGNGITLLPKLLNRSKNKTAVFIDGPKGQVAIDLAVRCLKEDHVSFVGIHDTHKLSYAKVNKTREVLDGLKILKYYSDECLHLDCEDQEAGGWKPYHKMRDNVWEYIGSYGPTICFLFKEYP